MDLNPIVLSIPIFFLLIGIELIINYFSQRKAYRLNDMMTNISCGITQQVSGIFLKIFGIGIYTIVYEYMHVWEIPTTWYSLIILFIATDFFYYWAHRMSHEVNLFWSGHVVHHQSEDFNLSVALRQSSFQTIWTGYFYLPLAIIGFAPIDFALMAALTTLYQFWIHTPYIKKLGILEYIIVTPSHHRVHHGRNPKYIDKNHGGAFIWWDMMFGTYQKEEETPTYGITTPVNSWNPVYANFSYFKVMGDDLKQINGVINKLKYLIYKPGWLPENLGGYRPVPKVEPDNYQKFDTISSQSLNLYAIFQYLVLMSLTSWFLFKHGGLAMEIKFMIAFLIAIGAVTVGALFENKQWVRIVEFFRIIGYSLIPAYFVYWEGLPDWLIHGAIIYSTISMLWFFNALSTNAKKLANATN